MGACFGRFAAGQSAQGDPRSFSGSFLLNRDFSMHESLIESQTFVFITKLGTGITPSRSISSIPSGVDNEADSEGLGLQKINTNTGISDNSPSPHDNHVMLQDKKKRDGIIIEDIFQSHFPAMIEQINPEIAARRLYGYHIINHNDLESALLDKIPKSGRSSNLLMLLIKKLKWEPDWCPKVIFTLKEAGVNIESINTALTDAGIDLKSEEEAAKATVSPVKEWCQNHYHLETVTAHLQVQSLNPHEHSQLITSQQDQHANVDSTAYYEGQTCTATIPHHVRSINIPEALNTKEITNEAALMPIRLWGLLDRTESEIMDKDNNTPLHAVARIGDKKITDKILEYAPSIVNRQNKKNQTALHVSIEHRSISVATRLFECKQLNPYLLDEDERTVLHYACLAGVTELVKLLLKLCSEKRFMNAADVNGDTALHIATRKGYTDIMKRLLKKKADKKTRNHKKQTPMDIAKQQGNKKAIKRLSKFPYFNRHVHKMTRSSTSPALSSSPSMSSISTTYSQASSMCSALAEVDTDEDDSD